MAVTETDDIHLVARDHLLDDDRVAPLGDEVVVVRDRLLGGEATVGLVDLILLGQVVIGQAIAGHAVAQDIAL